MALLEVKDLTIKFGGLTAVDNFNITIDSHELVGLIGPNGAGKTTVFNMLTGVYLPTNGTITIDGKSAVGKKPEQIVAYGAARTFQNIRLFKELTVEDNVKIAFHNQMNYSLLQGVFRMPSFWAEEKLAREKVQELLELFDMQAYSKSYAKNLPYGKQRKLE
ncbi:MAG: ABC transporter ATP-binding protein, partial [Eubacteriaceae bacterium]|nr:ABC transporter ATP-binding protein [Eubacteriaceae bacterium]